MKLLRTPDERFANLPDYPFEPHYVQIPDGEGGSLRVHYVDEGPADGEVVLLLHGEPSWSFLYRKMIPIIADAGFRVIAPDLVGFGRSDKPTDMSDYSFQRLVDWTASVVNQLDLQQINLFGQDWGGLIGLRVVADNVDRFARLVIANTGLPSSKMVTPEMSEMMGNIHGIYDAKLYPRTRLDPSHPGIEGHAVLADMMFDRILAMQESGEIDFGLAPSRE